MSVLFEVRIPTYNRPELLRRAIESLQAQTYPHWTATVYDEATAGEDIVRSIADKRITYRRNPQRLGACANIDQCFSAEPNLSGHYSYVLEDDNFLLPGFLARVADELEKRRWPLIQVNQRIWSEARGMHPESETTRGDWFAPGTVDLLRLRAAALFVEGLSNGGVVWRLGGSVWLRVGKAVTSVGIQETCRSLLVQSPFLFIDDPLAVFTYMPKAETARSIEHNRMVGRGQQSIRRFILKRHGRDVVTAILSAKPGLREPLSVALAHSGYPHLIPGKMTPQFLKANLKGLALRMIQKDPCAGFLAQLDETRRFANAPDLPKAAVAGSSATAL